MNSIINQEFGGERPLFASHHLHLKDVTIHAGESALKECSDLLIEHCRFEGKYPFWHVDGFTIRDSFFTSGARAALWYSKNLLMEDTLVEAPKMFREMTGIRLRRVRIPDAQETLWHCRDIELQQVELSHADYLFMHSQGIHIKDYRQLGNYSFQYCRDVEIHQAFIDSKDAFWNSENVTVYDSELNGEYLGWHSRNLRLVNCRITGTQPLCYATNLILENCTMGEDCDLAFEYSTVQADVRSHITSVKNPAGGYIHAASIGEIILDEHCLNPGACAITSLPAAD